VHHETWSKVSVVLFDRQIHDLDRLTEHIRARNGKAMNRAEIIRALIDGLTLAPFQRTQHEGDRM